LEATAGKGARLVATGSVLVVLLALAAPAGADPQVLSTKLSAPAVVGKASGLTVRAVDDQAPVAGATASYGKEGGFGISACYAPTSTGAQPGPPFTAGSPVTISLPHTFQSAGQLNGLVRIDAGGCLAPADSLFQPFTTTAVMPGETPQPLILGVPIVQQEGSPLPSLPGIGGGSLPPLPPLPVNPPPIPLPDPPPIPLPNPPTLPGLPGLPLKAQAAAKRTRCKGASRRVGKTRRSRRIARKAVLCLLNRERRAHGLKPLHTQTRLFTASFRHSRAMVKKRFFAHVQPGGIGLLTRLVRTHYLPARAWNVGENIAWGQGAYDSPKNTVNAWMHSTGHRANILRPGFRQIGIGIYRGVPTGRKSGATYTTDFGFRR
jgi:uncharacterized protein YkwD